MSHRGNFPLNLVPSEFYIFFNFGEKKSILTYEKPELVGKLIQEKNSGDLGNSGRGICEKIYGGVRKLDNTNTCWSKSIWNRQVGWGFRG
jgi:hypothetical protein